MSTESAIWLLLAIALVAANLPWASERFFLMYGPKNGKRGWMRLSEWAVLYFVVGGIAFGLEKKLYGETHSQGWEFYAVTVAIFAVFAMPGFIYRHILRRLLLRR